MGQTWTSRLTREEEFDTWLHGSIDEALSVAKEYPSEQLPNSYRWGKHCFEGESLQILPCFAGIGSTSAYKLRSLYQQGQSVWRPCAQQKSTMTKSTKVS
jgi:hypothetical protein